MSRGHFFIVNGKYKVFGDTIILKSNIQPKQNTSAYWLNESFNPFSDSIEIKIHYDVNKKENFEYLVSMIKINDCFWAGKGRVLYYIDSFYVKIPFQKLFKINPISYNCIYPEIILKDSNSNVIDIYINFEKLDKWNLELGSYSVIDEKYLFRNDTLVYLVKNCNNEEESGLFNYKRNYRMPRKQLRRLKKTVLRNRNNYYLE